VPVPPVKQEYTSCFVESQGTGARHGSVIRCVIPGVHRAYVVTDCARCRWVAVQNRFDPVGRRMLHADAYRGEMTSRFVIWNEVTGLITTA
jgi:hypothetical protein